MFGFHPPKYQKKLEYHPYIVLHKLKVSDNCRNQFDMCVISINRVSKNAIDII